MSRFEEELDDVIMEHHGVAFETDLAVGVYLNPRRMGIKREPYWIPKSVMVDINETSVTLAGWWAEKEGV